MFASLVSSYLVLSAGPVPRTHARCRLQMQKALFWRRTSLRRSWIKRLRPHRGERRERFLIVNYPSLSLTALVQQHHAPDLRQHSALSFNYRFDVRCMCTAGVRRLCRWSRGPDLPEARHRLSRIQVPLLLLRSRLLLFRNHTLLRVLLCCNCF